MNKTMSKKKKKVKPSSAYGRDLSNDSVHDNGIVRERRPNNGYRFRSVHRRHRMRCAPPRFTGREHRSNGIFGRITFFPSPTIGPTTAHGKKSFFFCHNIPTAHPSTTLSIRVFEMYVSNGYGSTLQRRVKTVCQHVSVSLTSTLIRRGGPC